MNDELEKVEIERPALPGPIEQTNDAMSIVDVCRVVEVTLEK